MWIWFYVCLCSVWIQDTHNCVRLFARQKQKHSINSEILFVRSNSQETNNNNNLFCSEFKIFVFPQFQFILRRIYVFEWWMETKYRQTLFILTQNFILDWINKKIESSFKIFLKMQFIEFFGLSCSVVRHWRWILTHFAYA